nr:hypothetical protein [Tanacetum cinerariifolium]
MKDGVDINTLTMEQYLAWVQDKIRPGVVKPKIKNDVEFEININFMRELRRKLFKGTDDEDAYAHVQRVLKIADIFHFLGVTHDVVMLRVFPITPKGSALRWINRLSAGLVTTWDLLEKVQIFYTRLDISTCRMLDSREFVPLMTPTQALKSIQIMAEHSHDWYDETTIRETINDRSDNIDAIQIVLTNTSEKDKTRIATGNENMKEPIPHDLPAVQTYVPPMPFLGHLKGQIGSLYRTREIVCMIGNPKEIHKMKAQKDEGDMDVG